jgi:transposase InsO family protein
VITKDGITTSRTKVEKIKQWPVPKNADEVRSFLGLCAYYRRHINGYAGIVAPLETLCQETWTKRHNVAKKKTFVWDSQHKEAFDKLKQALMSAPILAFPINNGEYILDTDASHDTIGAVLSQRQDGQEKVIAYASNKLSKAERNYCVTRKELLAVYHYVKQFSHYLYGRRFLIRTDHKALTWLLNWENPTTSQYNSWIAELVEYDMKVEHRPGKQHANADGLSRIPRCEQCELIHESPMKKRNVKDLRNDNHCPVNRSLSVPQMNQEDDAEIQIILKVMKAGKQQEKMPIELQNGSKAVKVLWSRRRNLRIRDGRLYFLTEKNNYAWVVPRSERKRLVCSVHKGSGHVGITKCAAIMKDRFYWPNMEEEIRLIINMCLSCQKRKSAGARITPEPQITQVGFPFEKIALDITGPLKPCRTGERYILGIIDYFTKYPMLIPIHNVDAKTVARALVNNWISTFGAPSTIHSDRGTSFESSLFYELCALFNIRKTKSAPFYPQSDGLIERLFRTVKDMIFATSDELSRDWKDTLPIISMGLRSSIQSSTGVSPYEAVFGTTMRIPLSWEYPVYVENSTKLRNTQMYISEYIIELKNKLSSIHDQMKNTLKKAGGEEKGNVQHYAIGDHVMARILPIKKGIDQPRYDGPYKVIATLGKWTYRLRHCFKRTEIERNIHHLKRTAIHSSTEPQPAIPILPTPPVDSTTSRKIKSPVRTTREKRRIQLPNRFGFPIRA